MSTAERVLGQVKWFNNKVGYGFITVAEGEFATKDIFVHYSKISTEDDSQYLYLVQGEYVEFVIERANTDKHEYQATAITGVKGGKMICQTRIANTKIPSESTEEKPYRRYKLAGDKRNDSPKKPYPRPVGRKDRREPKKVSPVVSTESVAKTM
jgi:cold shock CspA family protein